MIDENKPTKRPGRPRKKKLELPNGWKCPDCGRVNCPTLDYCDHQVNSIQRVTKPITFTSSIFSRSL